MIQSISGTFEHNSAKYHGGAIHNGSHIQSITADFNYNTANDGGAISNSDRDRTNIKKKFEAWVPATPTISSVKGNFTGNRAYSYGGAIYIMPNWFLDHVSGIREIRGAFTNNMASSGGAIYTESNSSTQVAAEFYGNSANARGGAIYYDGGVVGGTLTVASNFINNYAGKKGGAIYVQDNNLHVVTGDDYDITFRGNKQDVTSVTRDDKANIISVDGGVSNAIYNNDYVEFNAKEGRTIWMYDRLADSGDNDGWEWEKTGSGTLALGEDMSEITGDVLITAGTIKLVQNPDNASIYGTGFYKADDVEYEDNVSIDSQNNHIEDVHLGTKAELNGTLHSLIDVNLANQTADKLIAGGNISGSGSIVIDAVNIITGGGSYLTPRSVLIADDYTKGKIWLGSGITVAGEGFTNWALSYAPTTGILKFSRDLNLKEVANATDPALRVYNAAADEILRDNIGNIGNDNTNLTVNMNNYAINGKDENDILHSGFVTTSGTQKLTVNNANVGNFYNNTGNGSFIYDNNGAEININNSTFMNNEAVNGGVIYSVGKLTLTDTSFSSNKGTGLGGAIYSKGDVTVNAENKSVVFEGNSANSVANSIYMLGETSSPVTLALNSKDSAHTITINDGIDGNYYNTVINGAENNTGKVIFNNNVYTDDLEVKAGTLESSANLTVKSGINSAVISGSGNFTFNDSGASKVFENNGSFTQNKLTVTSGEFKTDTNNLHLTSDIVNDGTLVFNDTTNGQIDNNIAGSSASSNGIVEIAGSDGVTIGLNGKTITNNDVKLTSGIFDVTSMADDDGNIDISSFGLISGDGILNLQDDKAGTFTLGVDKTSNITLGDIVTGTGVNAKNLNIAIDMHIAEDSDSISGYSEYADTISVNSITGDGKIHVSDIRMSDDNGTEFVNPSASNIAVKVAQGAAVGNMDFTSTTISNIDKTLSSILLTYDSDTTSPTGGWLTVKIGTATLGNAIVSYVSDKLYEMGVDEFGAGINENIDNLELNGYRMSVITNGADILSTSSDKSKDGIIITGTEQTLTIVDDPDLSGNPETQISGFKTAIDNFAGATVYLRNIEMTGNETDVLNEGILNLDGINIIETIADDITPVGTTNIVGESSTIGSLVQKKVNIIPNAQLSIDADKLSATDGVDNWGTLNLGSGDLASNIFETQDSKQGVTNIVGDVTNTSGKTIEQKSVTISSTASLTTAADKVTADDGISNEGTLNLTDGNLASSISGTGTTKITGDVQNAYKTITQKEIVITDTGSLISLADTLIAENGISNAGELDIADGKLASIITGDGMTSIIGYVETNGNNITQKDVIVGYNGMEDIGYLANDAVINATNIDLTEFGTLHNIGTISADALASAGEVYFEDGNVNVGNIITAGNGTINIYGGNVNTDNIINNGETIITGGTVVADIIENANSGIIEISGGDVVANTSIINSGTGDTDINFVVKTPLVSATGGTINVNVISGQSATSNLLKDADGTGAADVTVSSGAKAVVNTVSDVMVVDNNVSGAGTLILNGNSGASQSSSDVGTEFYVSPNAVVSSAVNLAAGQLNTGDGANITGPISVAANATLNTINGDYSIFNNTTFNDGANLKVDVNAISNQSDSFVTPVEPAGGNIYLTDLNIQDISKISPNGTSINLSKVIGLNNLKSTGGLSANLNAKYGLTPIRRRNINVQMTPEGLMLNIAGMGNKYKDFNPAIMASPVAAQMGGYLTQLQSYDEAFRNMDMYMLMTKEQRTALKFKNKYAASDGGLLYDSTLMRQERAEGWFRPYATFEKVPLKNGPKVGNIGYGTYMGGESQMYDLGHGWDGMWGAYVGYNGSHQNYDGISIYQNGGTLGVLGMAYKGNFFTGLTLNAGASSANASTMYGSEDITMLMSGIASKTGYNWELFNGKFIIQPSWLMSYSFVNTFDYTNAAGVRMHSSPLNAIQLQPELKFIGNLKNGWQPYASVAMVWNIMDDTKFKANDVSLPELSVKPFVKYGIGLRKTWGERFTGFFQTYVTNGGRNGVGLQAGFTWALGKDPSKASR